MGSFRGFLDEAGLDLETIHLWRRQELPKTIQAHDGLVVLGGPMNVYEDEKYPFLQEEGVFIQDAVSRGVPTLGICLGAQLIVKACGARVTSGVKKEIGWHDLHLTPGGEADGIFSRFPRNFKVFQWHGDTFEIPRGATHLASSDLFPHQAFRYYNAYALQFHLEVDEAMVRGWMQEYARELDALPDIQKTKILGDTRANIAGLRRFARVFFPHFLILLSRGRSK